MITVSDNDSSVLKIKQYAESEDRELDFEITYQRTLTTQQRFEFMFRKSREIMEVMLRHGHRKPIEVVKRT